MRLRTLSVIALLALVWPTNARADTISILSDFGGSRVGYFFDDVRAPPTGGVQLGGLTMGNADVPGSTFPATFTAYCVQILSPILESGADGDFAFPVPYDVEVASMTTWSDDAVLVDNGPVGGQRAAYLYNTFGAVTGADERTALQMAIWEVLYDTDLDVKDETGRFYVDADLPPPVPDPDLSYHRYDEIRRIANDVYLQDLKDHPLDVLAADAAWLQLSFNSDSRVQDFIGPLPSATNPVPEPSAGLLLGMGVLSLAAFRSRKALFGRA